MPTNRTVYVAAVSVEDAQATTAKLARHRADLDAREIHGFTLEGYRRRGTGPAALAYDVPEGAVLYVSHAVQQAHDGNAFVSTLQAATTGVTVRHLSPNAWWSGWDAEPDLPEPPAVAADELEDLLRGVWFLLHEEQPPTTWPIAKLRTELAVEVNGLRQSVASAGTFRMEAAAELRRTERDLSDARARVQHLEDRDRQRVDETERELAEGRARIAELEANAAVPFPLLRDDQPSAELREFLLARGRTIVDAVPTSAAAPEVRLARSEVRPWIYVKGAGWWDGPWHLDDSFATDDAGTAVPIEEISATSSVDLMQGRQLPGSHR